MSLNDKARDTIARYSMLAPSDRVVVGISGGADSVALLHFLTGLKEELSLTIIAAHLNHGLRGAESRRDELFVRDFCKELGIELEVGGEDVAGLAARRGLSVEEAGRTARYGFFKSLAQYETARIATAHTLSDSVETAVLNLARGSALRGLCGIPPVRGNIIRPLITCERNEIEKYCRDNGLSYVNDSSNTSDDFARNRLRRHVTPVLLGINPGFFKTAGSMLEALRADADLLDEMARKAIRDISISGERFERAGYMALSKPLRMRALLLLLIGRDIPVSSERLLRLDEIIRRACGAEQLSESLYLKAKKEYFTLSGPEESADFFCRQADMPSIGEAVDIHVFSDKKLRLMNTDYEYYEENIKYDGKLLKNAIDCDKIYGIIKLRQKIPRDAVRLNGRGCTKTLKKLFQESGIPPGKRGRIFVLADSHGPLWVEGFGAAERAAVTVNTKRVLILNVLTGGKCNEE